MIGCYLLAGAFDFLLKVVAEDLDAYAEFAVKKLLRLPGVTDIRSSFVMEAVKDSTELPLDHLGPKGPAPLRPARRRRR